MGSYGSASLNLYRLRLRQPLELNPGVAVSGVFRFLKETGHETSVTDTIPEKRYMSLKSDPDSPFEWPFATSMPISQDTRELLLRKFPYVERIDELPQG
jgi:hypothetical protein